MQRTSTFANLQMVLGGQEWIRTTEVERQRIYSPPHLAALEPARFNIETGIHPSIRFSIVGATCRNRTNDLLITNQLLYQLS